ncbi:hypothetical protein C3747_11g527 [Trypanosoma cruzi]|uniref:Uncharacterized protein n=1 Tax=Trypanosoma cruzi TaxID=5693 RepID=A0A2V2XG74_TRYCR|nr:hypothetical protein C3747_11g527 [Trypanosoma cruzi]
MVAAFTESLQREVDTAIQEAASHRGGLRRRVAAACDRIRQQQALARAEALTPLFRADLLRRGRAIQKNRARLMQTLKRFARVLPSADLCESSGLPNVVAVLRVAQEALRVEEELAYWRQPLPCEEAWCAVCTAVREGGYRADAPLQLPAATEQQQHRRRERQEAALEHLLFPVCTNVGSGEEEETAAAAATAPAIPWIALPCFCTVTHFCRHEQVPVVAAAAKGNSGSQPANPGASGEEDDAMHDEMAEAERGVSSDGRVTQMVLDATAAHLGRLAVRAGDCSSSGEDEEAADSALEEVRLRVSLEVAARVTACRHAVESLAAGEDGMLLDGVTTVTAAAPLAVPVMALVLPPMEQLFFCIAYTIGAAILRDEQNERGAAATTSGTAIVVDDDDDDDGGGWKGAWGRWMRQEGCIGGADNAPVGPRLPQYLLEYVFCPAECESQRKGAAALVRPSTVRRWLELALGSVPDKDGAMDAMMTLYMNRR